MANFAKGLWVIIVKKEYAVKICLKIVSYLELTGFVRFFKAFRGCVLKFDQLTFNAMVDGSNPSRPTMFFFLEQRLRKDSGFSNCVLRMATTVITTVVVYF